MVETLERRPLYRRVKAALVGRIAEGRWQPGQLIPSEFEIAREIGVSQGTVRKALDSMAADNLLLRRQGKGTYVARPDEAQVLFRFFRLAPDDGAKTFPESRVIDVARGPARTAERAKLAMDGGDVIRVRRVRDLAAAPAIFERIVVPARLFPGLDAAPAPNNLYALYADRYGVTVAGASERLKAVAAGAVEARALGVGRGAPLLSIDRIARAVDGRPIEWRVSVCRTDAHHYASELR
jgi:GntR family transcriptional regulator